MSLENFLQTKKGAGIASFGLLADSALFFGASMYFGLEAVEGMQAGNYVHTMAGVTLDAISLYGCALTADLSDRFFCRFDPPTKPGGKTYE